MTTQAARQFARLTWIGLILWQFAWLYLLPSPRGKENLAFALVITVPLLIPLPGILALKDRALIWGAYLALFASMLGMTELWTDAAERPAAGLQLALAVAYLFFVARATHRRKG
jgi:uncharacterized membrane protein